MRPITVTVGPLGAAGALSAGQPIGMVGCFNLTSVPAPGTVTTTFQGNCSITGSVLTVNSTTSGVVAGGMRLSGAGVAPNTRVVRPGVVAGTWMVAPSQTLAATVLRGNLVITLDAPRQITITNTEPAGANSFTVTGTDAAGSPISETMVSTGAAVTTSQNFATVTSVYCSAPLAASALASTAATATSPWVMFDPWAYGNVSYMAEVNGVANYTVQITNDDPNSPTNPVLPGGVLWAGDPNANMVGASANQFASWQFIPLFARVLLNSGAGSVTATFIQPGVVNR